MAPQYDDFTGYGGCGGLTPNSDGSIFSTSHKRSIDLGDRDAPNSTTESLMTTISNHFAFPHEKLDAWHRSREARQALRALAATLPKGQCVEQHQANKAAGAVIRNICEGAARRGPGEKRYHFNIANAESAEVAGTVQDWIDAGMVDTNAGYHVIRLYGRVGAMMVGLMRKLSG